MDVRLDQAGDHRAAAEIDHSTTRPDRRCRRHRCENAIANTTLSATVPRPRSVGSPVDERRSESVPAFVAGVLQLMACTPTERRPSRRPAQCLEESAPRCAIAMISVAHDAPSS